MIGEVKGLATIRGYRNLPRGDVAALARAIAAFSALAHQAFADVAEAEINPLLVKREATASWPSTGWWCWGVWQRRSRMSAAGARSSCRKSSSTK